MVKYEVEWKVLFSSKAKKQSKNLPIRVKKIFEAFRIALENFGPIQKDWPHFSALNKNKREYHCWLKAGRPTYVVVWHVVNGEIRLIKITYVGTHEGAPY